MGMSYEDFGGDASGERIFRILKDDYRRAGRIDSEGTVILDDATGVWEGRVNYDRYQGMPLELAIAKHRRTWCTTLGLDVPTAVEAPKAVWGYRGNMCGIRVPGLPPIEGGRPGDPSLLLSWFYPFYSFAERQMCRDAAKARNITDWQLSWPDAKARGLRAQDFAAICMELATDGFMPTAFLLSKDFDPHQDVAGCLANIAEVTPWLVPNDGTTTRRISRMCVGWELGLDTWLTAEQVQQIVVAVCPQYLAAGVETYVHFQQGYSHLDYGPQSSFPHYWNERARGFLHGIMHQRELSWTKQEYRWRLEDVLRRFAGGFGTTTDNGIDGRPFRCIAFEITAWNQFNDGMNEDEGNGWGQVALEAHEGETYCAGSGNGQ